MAGENVMNAPTAGEKGLEGIINQFTGVFGQPAEAVSKIAEVVSKEASQNHSVLKAAERGLSSLKDVLTDVKMPSSLEDVFNLPAFSMLKEKFAFLDSIDIFEISQEQFNEMVEGGVE